MTIAVQKNKFFYHPSGMISVILLAAVTWMLFPGNLATLAMLTVGIVFIYGFNKPIWAIAAFVVSQFTITSYMVYIPAVTISLRLFLLLLIGIILWRSQALNKIELGPRAKGVFIPVLILFGLSIVSNLIYTDFEIAFKDFRNMLVGVLVILFFPAAVRNMKQYKTLCAVAFMVIAASAIVAIMQHYQFFGIGQNTLIPNFLLQWGDQLRVPGMAETELELSYIICTTFVVVLGINFSKGITSGNRWLMWLSILPMGLALYYTYTRSALVAVAFGLIALVLFLKTRIKGEIVLFGLLITILVVSSYGILEGNFLGGREESAQQESSLSRQILWQAGVAIAMDNPVFGIGAEQFTRISPQYSDKVDPDLLRYEENAYWGYRTLGNEAVHNDFLDVWISYGTLALIAYLWIILAVLRNFLYAYRKSHNRFIIGASLGLAGGLMAYLINSYYHNCMQTMPFFWILAGFSMIGAKLAAKEEPVARITQPPAGAGS